MNNLLILGIGLIIFGICFTVNFFKEHTKEYIIAQGKIADVQKTSSPTPRYYGYTSVIEYRYNGKTYQTNHRITTAKPKYKVNDIVEIRIYKDKPDKALINSKINLYAPIVIGVPLAVIGIFTVVISICLK